MAKSTLSSVLEREEGLGRRERALEGRLLPVGTRTIPQWQTSEVVLALMVPAVEVDEEIEERNGKKIGWKREMESLFKEVEALFDVISSDAQTADDGQQRHASSDPDRHREGASS
jgi:hypothetical protein